MLYFHVSERYVVRDAESRKERGRYTEPNDAVERAKRLSEKDGRTYVVEHHKIDILEVV